MHTYTKTRHVEVIIFLVKLQSVVQQVSYFDLDFVYQKPCTENACTVNLMSTLQAWYLL